MARRYEQRNAEARVKLDRASRPNEFSYPAVVSGGGALHVTYTWKRRSIAYRRITWG